VIKKFLCTVVACAVTDGAAHAQQSMSPEGAAVVPAQSSSDAAVPGELIEIVVTAQKRSERLQDVPISITAVTGEQLVDAGVTDTSQLTKVVPGFAYQQSSYGTPIYSIRGIGFYDTSVGISPAVSVYLDQAPLPFSVMARGTTLDLERVEVLKGPQGTLFGQNSTGGAINYIAAKPTATPEAGVDFTYGRFNEAGAGGFISGALAPGLNARFSGRYEHRDPWQQSYAPADVNFESSTNDTLGARRFGTGRLLLDWEASDRLRFELNVNGWRDTSDTQAAQFESFAPQLPQTPFNAYVYDALANLPSTPNNNRYANWTAGQDNVRDDWFYQTTLRGDYEVNDHLWVTSISSYGRYWQNDLNDVDGVAFDAQSVRQTASINSFFQELRLAGDTDRARWMVGANYQHDVTGEDLFAETNITSSGFGPLRWTQSHYDNEQRVSTEAAYGSVDFDLTPTVTASGSARYTKQDRAFVGCASDPGDGLIAAAFGAVFNIPAEPGQCFTMVSSVPPFVISPGGVHSSLDESNTSWRGNLSWKPNSLALLYANVTKGFKAGSFPVIPAAFASQFTPVTQESVLAYETGFKLTTLNHTLQLDGAAFYYDYRDKQLLGTALIVPFGNLPQLVNIPRSRVFGAELQAVAQPISGLRLSVGGTYVNSRVNADPNNPVDQFGSPDSYVGESFPNTPEWQVNGNAEYRWFLADDRELYIGANVAWRSSAWAAFGNDPGFLIPSYALLDLRAGMRVTENLDLQFWGRNITDTYYYTNVAHLTDTVTRNAGMPRTYGVTVRYLWGASKERN
jgi:iron complex outermembrane recepter protein